MNNKKPQSDTSAFRKADPSIAKLWVCKSIEKNEKINFSVSIVQGSLKCESSPNSPPQKSFCYFCYIIYNKKTAISMRFTHSRYLNQYRIEEMPLMDFLRLTLVR